MDSHFSLPLHSAGVYLTASYRIHLCLTVSTKRRLPPTSCRFSCVHVTLFIIRSLNAHAIQYRLCTRKSLNKSPKPVLWESCFSFSEAPSLHCGRSLQWCGPGCGQQGWSLWFYHRVEAFLYGILVFCLRKDYANFPANFHTATLLAACIQCTIFFFPLARFPICSPPLMKVDEILTQCICPKDDSQTRCMREMEENSRCIKQVEKCYNSKSIVAQHCVILRAH